jgi:methyl-accepting chemotaxis protein
MKASIRTRLTLLCGIALAAVALVSAQSWWSLARSVSALDEAAHHTALVRIAGDVDMLHDALRADVLQARLLAAEGDAQGLTAARDTAAQTAGQFIERLDALGAAGLGPKAQAAASAAATEARRYRDHATGLIQDLARGAPAAQQVTAFEQSFDALEHLLEAVTTAVGNDIAAEVTHTSALMNTLRTAALLLAASAAAVIGLSGLVTFRAILAPIRRLTAATRSLNSGDSDLTRRLPSAIAELDPLTSELNQFFDKLAGLVRHIQDSCAAVRDGSEEIAHGNADLQRRTESAAGSLQQTAASVEQITAAARHTAQTSHQACELAATASQAASRAGEVVTRAVVTMDDINAASQRISDIVSLINAIAFQTNILALNASIEAARAGSQGKGFGVVASEVRALSQRTAEAAREIEGLIHTSVAQVQSGTARVREAGAVMQEIVEKAGHLHHLVGTITAATREQSVGIGQVSQAVAALDRVTQENAALVEQNAGAAACLNERTMGLKAAVAGYQVSPA